MVENKKNIGSRLISCYIKNYKNFKRNETINFVSDQRIIFEDNRLIIVSCKKCDLYGEIINDISAVVGENGSGKSTLLEFIGMDGEKRINSFSCQDGEVCDEYFMIYHLYDNHYFIELVGNIIIENINSKFEKRFEAKPIEYLYSRCFTYESDKLHFYDDSDERLNITISTVNCMIGTRINEQISLYPNYNDVFITREMSNKRNYATWYNNYSILTESGLIKTIEAKMLLDKNENLGKVDNEIIKSEVRAEEITTFKYKEFFFCEERINCFFIYLFNQFANRLILKASNKVNIRTLKERIKNNDLNNFCIEKKSSYENIFDLLFEELDLDGRLDFEKYAEFLRKLFFNLLDLEDCIDQRIDSFILKISPKKDSRYESLFKCMDEFQDYIRSLTNYPLNECKFMEYSFNTYGDRRLFLDSVFKEYIPFTVENFGLSVGEMNFIDIASQIELSIRKIVSEIPVINFLNGISIILLVDELDATMHPEWSRRLINLLYQYFNSLSVDFLTRERIKDILSVQLILSTHSPFVLSDISHDNIVMLTQENNLLLVRKPEEDSRTFSKDIIELLENEFYMKDSLGEYSTNYINGLMSEIQCYENALKLNEVKKAQSFDSRLIESKLTYLIKIVGEPVLEKELVRIKEKYFGGNSKKYSDSNEQLLDAITKKIDNEIFRDNLKRLLYEVEND